MVASMALLSTLRPLPQRLLERLWLLLSGTVPTSIEYPMTMNALNDDCLLILFDTLSMPQLLQLRGVSRRLCHLIEGHSLRKFKSLIWNYHKKPYKDQTGLDTIRLHYAGRKDPYGNYGSRTIFMKLKEKRKLPASTFIPLRTRAWPLSLPRLLPDLLSLTLEYFLEDQEEAQNEEQLAINRRFVPYLNSNWSTRLTTLYLYIHVPTKPHNVQPDSASFAQLNQLTSLKHLFIDFSRYRVFNLLPDSMPVFGQLQTFLLRKYAASNTAILLSQLGPDLSILTLFNVNCSEDDCAAFLRARPNYARTLKTFDVSLKVINWALFTEVTHSLTSLVEFQFQPRKLPETELPSIFTDLSLLPNLQFIHFVPLFFSQLRVLLLRQHWPGVLPRLTSIRQASIHIIYYLEDPFQPSELFDQLLPLLPHAFCRLEKLVIRFYKGLGRRPDAALTEQLSTKVGQLFPKVKSIQTVYFV